MDIYMYRRWISWFIQVYSVQVSWCAYTCTAVVYSWPPRIHEPRVEIHFKFNGDFVGLIRLLSDFAHRGKL